uniref:Replication protein A 70 kDa DNA-binding subunit B/D first OB fold domain-containing protein n=1 Tax=Daucus carota subsp. sativus TaxID=79200 RepID=A0A161XT78_DAUCS
MQGRMFDHIQSLEKSRTNWRIKARLTRFWPTFSPETSTIKGYNLILLDDDNTHVHAYAYPDNWRAIGKEVAEGKIYTVENFQVRDTIGKLRPVSTKLCIRLLSSTIIECVEDDALIPNHKFEFMDMGDLLEECNRLTENQNPEFAYDVIGVVEHFKHVTRKQTRYGERDQTRFMFSDGRLKFSVTLWGDFASSVNQTYTAELQKPVIGILTSAKLSTFRQENQIGALPSTKIYFNLDIDPVTEFRERLIEEGYKSPPDTDESSSEPAPRAVIERTSFKELIENSLSFVLKRTVVVKFVINKIEEEDSWWFNSCVSCHSEVEKVDKKFKCAECKRNFGYCEKRFRIVVLADDTTLVTNVILLDRVVKRMGATTVANILNLMKKDSSVTAESAVFKSIVGKEVTALLQLSDANVNGDSNLYNVVDLCDSSMFETAIIQSTPAQATNSFSVDVDSPIVGIELFQTPGSSESVAKKIKMDFHVHAFVIPEALDDLNIPIYEGSMYIVENFVTRRAMGTLRPVTSDMCIILNETSIVTNIPLEIGRFPRYKFEITQLGDIYSIARNLAPDEEPLYALDIVGIIIDVGDTAIEATTSGMRQSVRFNLYDGRNTIRVVLLDEKVSLLGHILDGDYQLEPIVILTSMRPHFRNGVLQVSSTEATKVYVNIYYHAVWQIRRR